jgi:FkbM family methyltransferase
MGIYSVVFRISRQIERFTSLTQGKGYGSATIRQEVKLLQSFSVQKPRLAVDIGGNIGDYSAELRRNNPELEIHIFEPSKTNIDKLKNRFQHDKFLHIVPEALSHETGKAVLFSNEPGSGMGSMTKRRLDHFNIEFKTTEEIVTSRFEDYWRSHLGSREIDLAKIDVEGHELQTLQGFGEAINFSKVIQFEFGGCNIDTRTYFQDFWYFFKSHGFDIYRITPFGVEMIHKYREVDEFFKTTNFIAVRQKNENNFSHF